METRLSVNKLEFLRKKKGWNGISVGAQGRSGGLGLWWKPEISISLQGYNDHVIDVLIHPGASSPLVRFTGFFGEPKHEDRVHSWQLLERLSFSYDGAWYVGGDFNEILDNSEKFGGAQRAVSLMNNFRNAVLQCSLSEIPGQRPGPTWTNGRCGVARVSCKLDRGVVNSSFFHQFPHTSVKVLFSKE